MSFFKKATSSIKKAVKQVEHKVVKPAIKDAVPLAAAYFTGGASMSVLPPSNLMGSLMGGKEAVQEVVEDVQTSAQPYVDQYNQLASQLPSRKINSQLQKTSDYEKPARTAPEIKSSMFDDSTKKYLLFGGLGFAGLIALLVIFKR